MDNVEKIYCKFCNSHRDVSTFSNEQRSRTNPKCKICVKTENLAYRQNNKEYFITKKALYRIVNKVEIAEYQRQKWLLDKSNPDFMAKKRKQDSLYYEKNKDKIVKRSVRDKKERRKIDSAFRMQELISRAISKQIKICGGIKNDYVARTFGKEFIITYMKVIEALWAHPDNLTPDGKVWMSWSNHGMYNSRTWVDNDYSTHTWNIDHIKPISHFLIRDMNDPNVIICFGHTNVRPLSAKQNIKDGNVRSEQYIIQIKNSIKDFLNKKDK